VEGVKRVTLKDETQIMEEGVEGMRQNTSGGGESKNGSGGEFQRWRGVDVYREGGADVEG